VHGLLTDAWPTKETFIRRQCNIGLLPLLYVLVPAANSYEVVAVFVAFKTHLIMQSASFARHSVIRPTDCITRRKFFTVKLE